MTDYSDNDPRGWCGDPSRGAALGRRAILGTPEGVITIRESPLDRQGYDRNGTYFGVGEPLFWYADVGGNVDAVIRASSITVAASRVLGQFQIPGTKIAKGEPLPLPCWGADEDGCPDKANADADYGDLCETCAGREQEEDQ